MGIMSISYLIEIELLDDLMYVKIVERYLNEHQLTQIVKLSIGLVLVTYSTSEKKDQYINVVFLFYNEEVVVLYAYDNGGIIGIMYNIRSDTYYR